MVIVTPLLARFNLPMQMTKRNEQTRIREYYVHVHVRTNIMLQLRPAVSIRLMMVTIILPIIALSCVFNDYICFSFSLFLLWWSAPARSIVILYIWRFLPSIGWDQIVSVWYMGRNWVLFCGNQHAMNITLVIKQMDLVGYGAMVAPSQSLTEWFAHLKQKRKKIKNHIQIAKAWIFWQCINDKQEHILIAMQSV